MSHLFETACGSSWKQHVCLCLCACVLSFLISDTEQFVCCSLKYLSYVSVYCLLFYSVLVGCTVRMCECSEAVVCKFMVAMVCMAQSLFELC